MSYGIEGLRDDYSKNDFSGYIICKKTALAHIDIGVTHNIKHEVQKQKRNLLHVLMKNNSSNELLMRFGDEYSYYSYYQAPKQNNGLVPYQGKTTIYLSSQDNELKIIRPGLTGNYSLYSCKSESLENLK